MIRQFIGFLVVFLLCHVLSAQQVKQIDVYNGGTLITIQEDAILSINGDYIDESNTKKFGEDPVTAETLDAPIFLSGTLRLTGNIINKSGINTSLIYAFENATHTGKVILSGTTQQTIGGSALSYFPNLQIDNPAGVILEQPISIDNDLTLTNGALNLNGNVFNMDQQARIVGETSTNKIFDYDKAGYVSTAKYIINLDTATTDYRGIGLGYESGTANFSEVVWYRLHGPKASQYAVADGKHILRMYKMETSTTDEIPLITFEYHDAELNGLQESELALYVSNDNGLTWTKTPSTVDAVANSVTATNVPVVATAEKDPVNIFTLTISDCVANIPSAAITSTNAEVISGGNMNICNGNVLALQAAANDADYYRWTTPVGNVSTQNFGKAAIELADDGNYNVFVRNNRGCENTSTLYVNARANPETFFTITPDPDVYSICLGEELQFDDTSTTSDGTAINNWDWDFHDSKSTTSPSQNPSLVYPEPGEYVPSLVATSEYGCVGSTFEKLLAIQSLPDPDFRIENASGEEIIVDCEDEAINFINLSSYLDYNGDNTSALSYEWDFGDGTPIAADQNPTHAFATYGVYTINVRAIADQTGCSEHVQKSITITPKPLPDFSPVVDGSDVSTACAGIYVTFDNRSVMPDGTDMTYVWDFGDGVTSTEITPTRQFASAGIYNITLTASSVIHGCSDVFPFELTVTVAPEGDFTVAEQDICVGEEAVFVNNTTITSEISNAWDFGDGTNLIQNTYSVRHTYNEPGLYSVVLTKTTTGGCSNTVTRNIRVHPAPVTSFIYSNACLGQEVAFYNTSSIQSGQIESYYWDFGDGNSSTIENPSHLYAEAGDYNVTLTATSAIGCSYEATHKVSTIRNPSFDLGNAIVACTNEYTIDPFDDPEAYIPSGGSFTWTNAAGQVIGVNPVVTVSESGIYTATMVGPGPNSCGGEVSVALYLFDHADLGADFSACQEAVLDAEHNISTKDRSVAENTSYQWYKNGTPVSSDQMLTVTESGNYKIELTRGIGSHTCTSVDSVDVTIGSPVSVSLPASVQGCEGETVVLDAGVVASDYTWTNLSSGNIAGTEATLNVDEADDYELEVNNGGCVSYDQVSVTFNTSPQTSFGASALSVCTDAPVSFTNYSYIDAGSINSFLWDFGDATTSTASDPVKQYNSPGTYTVSLTATANNGCINTYDQQIIVASPPAVMFDLAPDVCVGESLNISNVSPAGAQLLWDFGDGTISSVLAPAKSYSTAGTYVVTLTATVAGCSSAVNHTVTVHDQPELEFGDVITTCSSSLILDAYNAGSTYNWFDPVSGNTLSTNQQYTVTSDGDIGLEVTSAAGCSVADIASVQLNATPTVNLGADRAVCEGEQLDAGYFPGADYLWSTGETTRTVAAVISGSYTVSVTDQNGCLATDQVNITVQQKPVVDLGADKIVCEGDVVSLDAGSMPGYTYLWSTGETTSSISVNTSGLYSVTVTNGSCSSADEIEIFTNDVPDVDFDVPVTCSGEMIYFTNQTTYTGTGALTYQWDFGDGTTSSVTNPSKKYTSSGTWNVSLTVTTEKGCTRTISKTITTGTVPVASFTTGNGCSDDLITFTNNSSYTGALSYEWNFGDGSTNTSQDPQHAYLTGGRYLVTLTATTAEGCSSTYSNHVEIGSTPSLAGWENTISACKTPVVLNAQNSGSSYLWSDNSTAQTLEVDASGVYSVTVTSDDGCSTSASVDVQLSDAIQPELPDATAGCGSVVLDPQVQAGTYLWSTGDNTNTLQVDQTGTYWLEVIDANMCVARDTSQVDIKPIPEIDLGNDIQACVGDVPLLDASSSMPVDYEWSTGENTSSIQVTESGIYSVVLTTNDGCSFTDEVAVTLNDPPVIDFEDEMEACEYLQLNAGTPTGTHQWSTGSTEPIIDITESGTYSVEVTDLQGCVSTATVDVTIHDAPDLELGDNQNICNGATATLDAGEAMSSYLWSDSSTDRYLTVNERGDYSVTVTDEFGCSATDNVLVTVNPALGLELGEDKFICSEDGVYLDAGVVNVAYQWGSTTGISSDNRQVRPNEVGTYWVTVTDGNGCSETDSIRLIHTNQTVQATFLTPSTVDTGDEVHFVQLSAPDSVSFYWSFGDGGTSQEENPIHRYFQTGDFQPTLVVSNGYCIDSLTKSIIVRNARFEEDPDQLLPEYIDLVNAEVYPNPSRGLVKLDLKLTAEADVYIRIYSLDGYVVDERKVKLTEDLVEFDLSDQKAGIYMIQVIVGGKSSQLKLVRAGAN